MTVPGTSAPAPGQYPPPYFPPQPAATRAGRRAGPEFRRCWWSHVVLLARVGRAGYRPLCVRTGVRRRSGPARLTTVPVPSSQTAIDPRCHCRQR